MVLDAVFPPIHNAILQKVQPNFIKIIVVSNIMNAPVFCPAPDHEHWETNDEEPAPVADGEVLPD